MDDEISCRHRHRVTDPADVIYNKPKHGSVRHFVHLSMYLRLSEDLILVTNKHVCYVVGSRRLMPPDALHPKAYCTIPGL